MSVEERCTVYVRLKDEGVPVWRPVGASKVGDSYLLEGPTPADEHWEFPPGALVHCRLERFEGDPVARLVAAEIATVQ